MKIGTDSYETTRNDVRKQDGTGILTISDIMQKPIWTRTGSEYG